MTFHDSDLTYFKSFADAPVRGGVKADAVLGFARAHAEKAILESSHMMEKQGGKMSAREGTKRKDACLNAESSINCSQTSWSESREPPDAAMSVISLRGLYRLSGAEHNLEAGKVQKLY